MDGDLNAREAAAAPAKPISGWLIISGVALPIFLASIDQTIVASALPAIARDLGGLTNISWVVIAYLLFQTVAAPIYGRLSDTKGRRRMMLVALAVLLGASVLCAVATSMTMLIVARGLQGCGGGGLQTLSFSIIGETIPPRERARYQAWLSAVYAASSVLGPVLGGWLSQAYGWHAVFWSQLPFGLFAFGMAMRLPALHRPQAGAAAFDFAGTLLFVIAAITLLLGLTELGRGRSTDYRLVGALFVAGVVSAAWFIRVERRADSPLLPLSIVANPSVWRADLGIACFGAAFIGSINFAPLYLQAAYGYSPADSALQLIPLTLALTFGAMGVGRAIRWTGRLTVWPTYGLPVAAMGLLALAFTTGVPWGDRVVIPALLVFGIGGGSILSVSMMVSQLAVPVANLGSSTATVNFSRAMGGAVGVATVSTVLFTSLSLIDPGSSGLILTLIDEGSGFLAHLGADQQAAIHAHVGVAFTIAFLVLAAFPMVAAVVVRGIPLKRLR